MRWLLACTILLLYGCSGSEVLNPKNREEITLEVTSTLENYFRDINSSGLLSEFRYLDSSDDFFWIPPGYNSPLSYDSVYRIISENSANYKAVTNSFISLQVYPHTFSLASYSGRVSSEMTDTNGLTKHYELAESGLLVRRKTGWKLLNGHTSITKEINP